MTEEKEAERPPDWLTALQEKYSGYPYTTWRRPADLASSAYGLPQHLVFSVDPASVPADRYADMIAAGITYIQKRYAFVDGVDQTIFAGNAEGIPGNCLQAAVATLLRLPLEAVPNFLQTEDWWLSLDRFAARHGYVMLPGGTSEPIFGLAFGPSPRGIQHAVVHRDGAVWDPHPDRTMLTSVSTYIEFVGRPE